MKFFIKKEMNSSQRLTTLIILFPLITLLLYGALSHWFFFYSQKKDIQNETEKYEKMLLNIEGSKIKEKVKNLIQFVHFFNNKNVILKYIKANQTFKNGSFFITNSKTKIILKPKFLKIGKQPFDFVQEGLYMDKKYIAYSDYLPKYDWYITAIKDITTIKKNIDKKRKKSELKREKNVQTNFYLLLLSWIISLILSLYLSIILNKKLKEYEKELRETNNKLIFQSRQAITGELLPMIAHQWRQPINKIASILALLRFSIFEKNLPKDLDKRYKEMEDNIEFMSETIDDFRTFYNPSSQTSQENLKTLIEKSINFIESSIRKKEINIELNLENIYFNLYKNEFLQVMINLIKNAVDSMDRQGMLKLYLFKEDKKVKITVEDNGKGIDKKDINKIFEPYFSTKKDSMGLGLYMSKIIIQKHIKGDINIESLEKGTRFIIVL